MNNNPPGKIKTPTPTPMIMTKPPDRTRNKKRENFDRHGRKSNKRIVFTERLDYKREAWDQLCGGEGGDSFGECLRDECREMDKKYRETVRWER